MNMKRPYNPNYSGSFPIPRAIQLLLKNKTLNFTLLAAYLCFVAQADWDKKHPFYSVIIRDDNELAKGWNCSVSTVTRKKEALIKKGLLYEKDGLVYVKNTTLFENEWVSIYAKLPPATLKTFFAKTPEEVANMLKESAKMQENQVQNTPQSFNVSSKGNSGFSTEDEEYINSTLTSDIEREETNE